MFTAKRLRSHTFPPEHHIIGSGLLKRNAILIIGGPPKSMKSMVSMSMAIDLAVGRALWGAQKRSVSNGSLPAFPVSQPHRVLIVEKEIGYEDCQVRLNAMWNGLNSGEQALVDENILIESCNIDLRLDTNEGTIALGRIIEQAKADVVILDPLVEFHQLDENHSQDMGRVFGNLDLLRYKHNFATIINHHRTKMPKDPNTYDDDSPESLRGSSRVFGKVDSVMMLRNNPAQPGALLSSFTIRRGRPIPPCRLRVDLDTLLTHFNGWLNEREEPAPAFRYDASTVQ